jgi:two-component system, OmpR family, copper resistance phosphate regulon response regulator CusR
MKSKVLIVEDEVQIAESLMKGLQNEGFEARSVTSGEEALFILSRESFDMVLLDVMLPGRDGFDVLKILRASQDTTPVIMLTARDSVEDKVHGLDEGADDYLVKPFAFSELVSRIRLRLRKSKSESTFQLSFEDLKMDLLAREAERAGAKLELTVKEFEVLEYLLRHRCEIVTRDMLAKDVWKTPARATPLDNVIDVHIARLRKKVDQEGQAPLIHTVRGVGFSLKSIGNI